MHSTFNKTANRPPPLSYNPPEGAIPILHQDDSILVLEKPSGLLTVPGKNAFHKDCLETRIQRDFPTARIVHRLDMDTSGVLVMAMNKEAHRHLGLQFERRHVDKSYQAIVYGRIEADDGVIDQPLRCDWPNRPKQMIDHKLGRSAITNWQVIQRFEDKTHVALFPKTGRSHQLRVHMLFLGHPILGDNLYAHEKALRATPRLCLHAESLALYHPNGGTRLTFTSPSPFS